MKNIRFFVSLYCLLFTLGFIVARVTFSEEPASDREIAFATTLGTLKFFDRTTGKVYKYSESDGKLMQVWVLEELGKDLKKQEISRSLLY